METFEVVMIGNTAVGKTSMLAALATELDQYNLNSEVTLEPTTAEFKNLDEQRKEMDAKINSQAPFTPLSEMMDATVLDFVEHKFDFKVEGKKEATVLFTDTRGGMTGELDEKLIARVNNAFGVFCVIDASVLMECPRHRPEPPKKEESSKPPKINNDDFNCPSFVKRLLKEVYSDGDNKQPRFVAFILTKCEKYMVTPDKQQELSTAFHSVYNNIVDMLRKVDVPPEVYVLAIQTMTCVSFYKLNAAGMPIFKVQPGKEHTTKDCAYPLVILLKELIAAIGEAKRSWRSGGPILHWLLILLGIRRNLKKYLGKVDEKVSQPEFYKKL